MFEGKEVKFAPQEQIEGLDRLCRRFLTEVVEPAFGISGVWVSDHSSLYDFSGSEEDKQVVIELTLKVFRVDIAPVYDDYLPVILQYIYDHEPRAEA